MIPSHICLCVCLSVYACVPLILSLRESPKYRALSSGPIGWSQVCHCPLTPEFALLKSINSDAYLLESQEDEI